MIMVICSANTEDPDVLPQRDPAIDMAAHAMIPTMQNSVVSNPKLPGFQT